MLILVGVTITVAMDGGLFEKSQLAKVETDKNSKKEQLVSALIGSYDSQTGTYPLQQSSLPSGWTYEQATGKVTDNKGNEVGYVDIVSGSISDKLLEGRYYERLEEHEGAYLEVVGNVVTSFWEGEPIDEVTYELDETNKKVIVQAEGQEPMEVEYEVKSNNKILIIPTGEVYSTTENFDYLPDGEYVYSEGGNNMEKWIISNTATEHTATREIITNGEWTRYGSSGWENLKYFGCESKYYIENRIGYFEYFNDSIVFEGKTYVKI